MRFYLIVATTAILLSSCLKQSIPDAMLASKQSGSGSSTTATLSYELNGNPVKITVMDADNQDPNTYTLGCSKLSGYYVLSGLSSSGETTFLFFTDSLTTGKYIYTGSYGDMFFISYNGQDEYAHAASDTLSFTIASYDKGHIRGSFSGRLTPLITASTVNNIYGSPSSIIITKGSFKNVPVFH